MQAGTNKGRQCREGERAHLQQLLQPVWLHGGDACQQLPGGRLQHIAVRLCPEGKGKGKQQESVPLLRVPKQNTLWDGDANYYEGQRHVRID